MRIGIYTPYLDTLSGGEKYILTAAISLAKQHSVFLFWDKDREIVRKRIVEKFGMDISAISFVDNIFDKKTSFVTVNCSHNWQACTRCHEKGTYKCATQPKLNSNFTAGLPYKLPEQKITCHDFMEMQTLQRPYCL